MSTQDLLKAAIDGVVEFLRDSVASNKPTEFYLAQDPEEGCNILHLAIHGNRIDFIKETIKILSPETIKLLLLQYQTSNNFNPLHLAATTGNIEIVKLFLDVYKSTTSSPPLNERPWLTKASKEGTPCHFALFFGHEDCGLEIWKMDMELLSNTLLHGCPLLLLVVKKGQKKWALEILRSPFSVNCTSSSNGLTALHCVANCLSGEEICKELLRREPELIMKKTENGISVLHHWTLKGKLWPFECLLKSIDIIPDGRKHFVELISATENKYSQNPFHTLAAEDTVNDECSVEIAKILINTYKDELASSQVSRISNDLFPWLIEDKEGRTPLRFALECKKERFVKHILSEDNNALLNTPNALLLAIQKGCHEVAEMILNIVDDKGWTNLLTDDQYVNALHLAPLCKRELYERLLSQHSELLEKVDINGATVLHSWVKLGDVWPFEYVLRSENIDHNKKSQLVKLISSKDCKLNNPLHVAASSTREGTDQIVKLLVEAFKEENPSWSTEPYPCTALPWFITGSSFNRALHSAMMNQNENLALYILSLFNNPISELLDYYRPEHKTLFLAVEKNCFQVAKDILTKLGKGNWSKYVTDFSDGQTILHLVPHSKDQAFGRWIVEEAPLKFITQKNKKGEIPLDEASNVGATSIIQAMLEKDPSVFNKAPLAWVKACENGHISTIRVFIDHYPGKFSDHCIQYNDSPLHHIKLRNLTGYEEFLHIPRMKDVINVQDFEGATPLHKAIQNKNIFLAEALLRMDKIKYNIKDQHKKTAKDLLEQLYKEQVDWKQMCESIGFDPTIKTTYFQHKSNLFDVRNTLALVAALLATITFTAGLTLPGGFDQNTGEAMLVKKAAFVVFLLSDTVAMCCSMLILIFLVWSMLYDPNKSLVLIDRSMKLLLISLYATLIAFMAGVYMVVSPKSLWSAILVIVMCSLIGILSNMSWLYKVRDKLFCRANKEDSSHKQPLLEQLEEGTSRDENDRLLGHPEESSQGLELGEITNAS